MNALDSKPDKYIFVVLVFVVFFGGLRSIWLVNEQRVNSNLCKNQFLYVTNHVRMGKKRGEFTGAWRKQDGFLSCQAFNKTWHRVKV